MTSNLEINNKIIFQIIKYLLYIYMIDKIGGSLSSNRVMSNVAKVDNLTYNTNNIN